MFATSQKMFLVCILMLVVLTTGAWQSNPVALDENWNIDVPETPLYPSLAWSNPSTSVQDIRVNINGDTISLSGERYESRERFAVGFLPQDVLNYYSNKELAKSGWTSYDTVEVNGGVHYIFFHDSGVYLSVEFLLCPSSSSAICVSVWKSEQTKQVVSPPDISGQENITTTASTFGKKTPANGATDLDPASVVLSWDAYSPTPDKYSYCVKVGSACDVSDPDWTSTYNTSLTLTNLALNTTYYWQVKAITCVTCEPKTVVYADNGATWTFKTKTPDHAVIMGNAGMAGAVLSYTDYTLKTVTADGYGNYSIAVPFNWSGTVTPSKSGYAFSPKFASFSNLTAPLTIQNFNAAPAYIISGSVVLSGVTLSYTDGSPQTVISNSDGTYSITVLSNWSGTVTPSKTGFTFAPVGKNYTNVTTNLTAQNYGVFVSISGHAGVAGTKLIYMDGTVKTVIADGSGNYSFLVPLGWSGTVTPYKSDYTFTPTSRSYTHLQASQTSQDYTVQVCVGCADVPSVPFILRASANPSSAASVDFIVFFSVPVTGVDSSDFALTTTGVTGAAITSVSGSSDTYTVSVNTGSGNGMIRLDVVDNDSIKDAANNPLGGAGNGNGSFTSGETYTIIKNSTFGDVPSTHPFWRYIEAFSNSGITVGCSQSPKLYCPNDQVTRGEMAVFLLRAKYGSSYTPNPSQTGIFADVPYAVPAFTPWIEQFYQEGITVGCNQSPLMYCPQNYVTRGEMAVFILRAVHGSSYQPNPSPTGMFSDLPYPGIASFTPWIEEFYNDGTTVGCNQSPLMYCPQNYVTRGEMAVFIDRAFGILSP